MIFDVYSSYTKQSMSSTAQNNRISRSETTGEFPWKKSVRWSNNLEEVHEYEKPFRKGSYGELSQRLGKPVRVLGKPERVLGKPERVLGKPLRVPIKVLDKQGNNCTCA